MYQPSHFEETRLDMLHGLIRAHPLAAFVALGDGELIANHIPLLIDASHGPHGTLRGHVARANPLWQRLSAASAPAIAIFQGPQAYISPSWYPSKHADGKAVPTWNYAVVHAHGEPRIVDDADWLLAHVTALTAQQEAGQALPWTVSDAPRDFIDRMLGAIVGIEMPIARIEGKWKVSQNRPFADRLGVAAGLESRADALSHAMAALVMERATR